MITWVEKLTNDYTIYRYGNGFWLHVGNGAKALFLYLLAAAVIIYFARLAIECFMLFGEFIFKTVSKHRTRGTRIGWPCGSI